MCWQNVAWAITHQIKVSHGLTIYWARGNCNNVERLSLQFSKWAGWSRREGNCMQQIQIGFQAIANVLETREKWLQVCFHSSIGIKVKQSQMEGDWHQGLPEPMAFFDYFPSCSPSCPLQRVKQFLSQVDCQLCQLLKVNSWNSSKAAGSSWISSVSAIWPV